MLGQAKRAIVRAGCRVGPIRMGASVLPPRGVILAQWPNAGTRLPFRGAVHLLVSLGPP
jgi:beta-lactam-binding protein with PASTA domain